MQVTKEEDVLHYLLGMGARDINGQVMLYLLAVRVMKEDAGEEGGHEGCG